MAGGLVGGVNGWASRWCSKRPPVSASMWCLAALVVGSVCEWHMGYACISGVWLGLLFLRCCLCSV